MKINVVQLERRVSHQIDILLDTDHIFNAQQAAPLFIDQIGAMNVEHAAMLALDNTNKVINYFVISIGQIDSVRVSLAQLFKNALLSNASKIIVAHNHPSGVLKITSTDIDMTRKIGFFAKTFSIELIDSMIVSEKEFVSIRAHCKEFLDE